jgi:hypothetical protein
VQQDEAFGGEAVLDRYAEAWALTFYLFDRRSPELSQYLKVLHKRPMPQEVRPEERLKDFLTVFGRDLTQLESHVRRYFAELDGSTGLLR